MARLELPTRTRDARYDLDSLPAFQLAPQPRMPQYPFTADERAAPSIYMLDRFSQNTRSPRS